MVVQALAGFLAAAGAGSDDPAETVATVNGTAIVRSELDGAFRKTSVAARAPTLPPAELHKVRTRVLQALVNRKLLSLRMAELKVPVNEMQVEEHVRQIAEAVKKRGETLADFLRRVGEDEERMRTDIREDCRWLNFVESQAKESVLRKYFDANLPAYEGTMAKCRHLLIAAPEGCSADQKKLARNRATDLRARIASGESFDKLAREHSDCPSKSRGGLLDDFPRKGAMSEPFAAAAFGLKPGELSEVVETEFGCHLIVMVEKKAGMKTPTFDEAKDAVKSDYAEDLRRATLADLRRRADVRILLAAPIAAAAAPTAPAARR